MTRVEFVECKKYWRKVLLGTTASKPYKHATKSHQNDTVLLRKTMIFIIYIEPEKEFE